MKISTEFSNNVVMMILARSFPSNLGDKGQNKVAWGFEAFEEIERI